MSDFNKQTIEEFRGNAGKVGGMFEGAPLLILHCMGAKSGLTREIPLMYQGVDGSYAIFASKAGADTNPDWYHNLVANSDAKVEVGNDTVNVIARVAGDDERDEIWNRQKRDWPQFESYEQGTSRKIPVVVLDPRG